MTNFDAAVEAFVAKCTAIVEANDAAHFPRLAETRTTTITAEGGKKFARVVRAEVWNETGETTTRSAFGFIALADGQNKKLGAYRAGDVFKADGWAGPARTARGNIFDDKNGTGRVSPYSVG